MGRGDTLVSLEGEGLAEDYQSPRQVKGGWWMGWVHPLSPRIVREASGRSSRYSFAGTPKPTWTNPVNVEEFP